MKPARHHPSMPAGVARIEKIEKNVIGLLADFDKRGGGWIPLHFESETHRYPITFNTPRRADASPAVFGGFSQLGLSSIQLCRCLHRFAITQSRSVPHA